MLSINPSETPQADLHQYLLGAVSPRPICFASTISKDGVPNLAPYSFFNVFSSNPPVAVFSSNRRGVDNTTKDTLANVLEQGEVVINVVTHDIVHQMTVTSINYPSDTSEFEKAGLTPLPSDLVQPFRVAESPVQMECKVRDVISLGETPGAGNLILCDIIRLHINEAILGDDGKIDPHKIDLMGRMGRAFYCRASGAAISKIFQPVTAIGIGADQLPEAVRNSEVLTGNDIGKLAALTKLPSMKEVLSLKDINEEIRQDPIKKHQKAKELIANGEVEKALALLIAK